MSEIHHYNVLLEWDSDERVWVSYVSDLNCLSSFGENRDEAIENTRDPIRGYPKAAAKEGTPVPEGSHHVD